jgi:hypothetical protein
VDEGEQAGPTALAAVSDLMTALMVVFLFGGVAASELARAPKPEVRRKGSEVWGLNAVEFDQRQLKLRVEAARARKFQSFKLQGSTLVLTLASARDPLDDPSTARESLAVAKRWTAVALDTPWREINGTDDCPLGISPAIAIKGSALQSKITEVRNLADALRMDLQSFVTVSYKNSITVGESSYFAPHPHVDLIISFALDPATRKALAERFSAGPPAGAERDRMWCR